MDNLSLEFNKKEGLSSKWRDCPIGLVEYHVQRDNQTSGLCPWCLQIQIQIQIQKQLHIQIHSQTRVQILIQIGSECLIGLVKYHVQRDTGADVWCIQQAPEPREISKYLTSLYFQQAFAASNTQG